MKHRVDCRPTSVLPVVEEVGQLYFSFSSASGGSKLKKVWGTVPAPQTTLLNALYSFVDRLSLIKTSRRPVHSQLEAMSPNLG